MTTHADRRVEPGDIVLVAFQPVRGIEQDGTRPALVISSEIMHDFSRRAIVCPITRNPSPWPTKVFLPDGLAAEGAVLADQIRAIDRSERILKVLGTAPLAITRAVRERVAALIGIDCVIEG
jgi:mRNA interferase MazF